MTHGTMPPFGQMVALIYVYIDGRLLMTAEDTNPELGAGQILLQVNASNRAVRFDNFTVQQAEPFSSHFEGATSARYMANG